MVFVNETGVIGQILERGTTLLTGDMAVTLIIILIILIAFALMFSIPLEYTTVLGLPLIIAYASYYQEFGTPLIIALFYLAIVITPRFLIK